MHSRILSLVMATGALLASPGIAPAADSNEATKSVHADRGTPRLQLFSPGPAQARSMAPATDEGESAQKLPQHLKAAWRFLSEHAADYGLTPDLSNLDLVETRQTLLGTTFRFKQLLGGQRVADGEIVVSVNDAGQVQQVYNNIYPVPANKAVRAATAQVGRDKAEQVAWDALGAQGLLGEPMAELKYVPTASGDFVLAYDVRLYVERKTTDGEKRSGLWQVLVDAVDGEVIGQPSELTVNEGKRAGDQAYVGQAADFGAVVSAFRARRSERAAAMESVRKESVSGKGLVFDPDPVTTLKDTSLVDGSPAATFDPTYVEVVLPDLTKRDGAVFLEGPWVRIEDFEPPATPPSSRPDGIWRAKRGDDAFNDVMTYYHIDRSQRYLQSLGYTGARGIQALPIVADSDGLNGDDNSHYVPSINRLAFGHGCVDDNEDVDVILHEYGHALTQGIDPSWGGGDSGAIGEGFGDYWAATYSLTTVNGTSFQPEKVFNWDGIDSCWGGRHLNVTGVLYDPRRTYGAHQPIGGGVQSDELWSTPLVQSLTELRRQGVPREEVDKVVLESMFGLGAGFRMPDLATKTVAAAKALFPSGPHAGVFESSFRKLGILPDGQPSAAVGAATDDAQVSKK